MRFATLGSGSAGNAVLIEHAGTALLIDCGLSWRQVERRAARLDFDLTTLHAVLVTHEHDDHVSGVAMVARRLGIPVYLSGGTRQAAGGSLVGLHCVREVLPEHPFELGPFSILPLIVPHDAREPCQFVVTAGGLRLGVLTDVGRTTPHLVRHFSALDGLLLEFNHEPALLAASVYPASLKARIAGPFGHLSNDQAEHFLGELDRRRLRWVLAAHLSEKTNTPAAVNTCLERSLPRHVQRAIAMQAEASAWCVLQA